MAFLEPFIAGGEAFGELIGEAGAAAGEAAEGAAKTAEEGVAEVGEGFGRRPASPAAKSQHAKVTKTKDNWDALARALRQFTDEVVLVGVAADTAQRNDGGPINNATIGLIMERGSPAANIPARPWLEPGVMSAREKVIAIYLSAAQHSVRSFSAQPLTAAHDRVGATARDAVKKHIKSAQFTPLAASTVAARYRQRGAKRRRVNETKYLAAVAGGMSLARAQALYGIQPLINTGTFLNSVTYVVRKKSAKAAVQVVS